MSCDTLVANERHVYLRPNEYGLLHTVSLPTALSQKIQNTAQLATQQNCCKVPANERLSTKHNINVCRTWTSIKYKLSKTRTWRITINRVIENQLDAQIILSIFRQSVHVSGVSRTIIRRYNRMYTAIGTCYYYFYMILLCWYMFREYLGPSSGGTTVCTQQLVLIILFRWLSVFLPTRTTVLKPSEQLHQQSS